MQSARAHERGRNGPMSALSASLRVSSKIAFEMIISNELGQVLAKS